MMEAKEEASPSATLLVANVRESTARVLSEAKHVTLDREKLAAELEEHGDDAYSLESLPPSWSQEYHFSDGTELTAQYVLVLDALNFCFWPLPEYEYDHLARSLKMTLLDDKHAFDAERLSKVDAATLTSWLRRSVPKGRKAADVEIPMVAERARLVREIGVGLLDAYDGLAANLVRAARGSAVQLVSLVLQCFAGFRDHAVYNGAQVFFYKRAQIFVGDIWGAYEGKGLGAFSDIDQLTCFADYRIPQLLHTVGVLRYSDELDAKVRAKQEIAVGTAEELEIRAATVQAVEQMKKIMLEKQEKQSGAKTASRLPITSVTLDWMLWERGEAELSRLLPHHRTLTVYY